jgi:hypothetical protein
MLSPSTTLVPQGTPVSIQGRKFNPTVGAPALNLILPSGVQLPYLGPPLTIDANGNISIPSFVLGEGYPTGAYTLSASQASTATAPARTTSIAWRLIP